VPGQLNDAENPQNRGRNTRRTGPSLPKTLTQHATTQTHTVATRRPENDHDQRPAHHLTDVAFRLSRRSLTAHTAGSGTTPDIPDIP
jgi:hypothetical protein